MRIFISYSHHDTPALERLHVHLANLQREGRIAAWYDREILAGDVLDDEISEELEAADLFFLMISPDFIASNYCVEREMARAMERHQAKEARVVPIIMQPCDWAAMPELRQLKAVPKDGKPISEWANENNAYLNIVQELRRIIEAQASKTMQAGVVEVSKPNLEEMPRYRVKRDFDEIDQSEFREASFATMKDYFQRAIAEIDAVEGIRGRFVDRGSVSFGCTLINQERHRGVAHLTVHCRSADSALGDIYYSFNENAPENTANGGFNVVSDEYEQFLDTSLSMFGSSNDRLSAQQAAEFLWNQFIEQAGITYA